MNNIPDDIKSEIKLLADYVKQLVRLLSKDTTQMDLNKLSYWKDIWKFRSNVEKCQVQDIGSKNIKVEYELSNRKIKEVNKECDQGVGFDDTFKADNPFLSIV